ncbi:MAG: lytic transglycosylase domain-containing protein [Deltaproteobacteria bacterium]|jgi:hypothetical protein|nr:lytic transglycosylase domain-containing protein [Deltaproteobacteria bacterium]
MSRIPPIRALLPALAVLILFSGCRALETGPGENPLPVNALSLIALEALGEPSAPRTDFQLPPTVLVCGEAIPLERPSARERLEYEFLLAANHPAQVELWRRRALRHFPPIEAALKESSLPDDLKYLAVAESDLRPLVFSPAGAAGIWQFMPSTARQFGLKVDKTEDRRMLPDKLLPAGLRYLSSLRNRFGNWALAMAAYNAGERRIGNAVSSQGTRDYHSLNLPRETERYVYRIAAIKLILENAAAMGFDDVPPQGLYGVESFNEESLSFETETSWKELAAKHGTDYKTMRLSNPHLAAKAKLKGGPFLIRSPKA